MKPRTAMTAALAALLAAAAAAPMARADDMPQVRPGVSFGGRGMYFKPKDGSGDWYGGAQLRFHLSSVLALEAAGDYRQARSGGSTVDVFPVQGSLLLYLVPHSPVSPFLLGGGGWYFSHFRGGGTDHRFAPHAGAGVEVFLQRHLSVDGTWRYVFRSNVDNSRGNRSVTLSDRGYMVTAGLNFWF